MRVVRLWGEAEVDDGGIVCRLLPRWTKTAGRLGKKPAIRDVGENKYRHANNGGRRRTGEDSRPCSETHFFLSRIEPGKAKSKQETDTKSLEDEKLTHALELGLLRAGSPKLNYQHGTL